MTKSNIGFIGLGLMGQGMAANILKKGWPLQVMAHRNRAPVEMLVAEGAREAKTPREMAEQCDVIVLCVTARRKSFRSSAPGWHRECGQAGHHRRLFHIRSLRHDEACSRSRGKRPYAHRCAAQPYAGRCRRGHARCHGRRLGVRRAARVAGTRMFRRSDHPHGPTGSGHTMKLLNNFLSMGYAALYSEALMLGRKAGLTPEVFDSVIRGGRMDCPFYQTFFRWVLERDPNAHKFAIRNGFKDMSYLAGYAIAAGVANPVGAAVRNSFAQAVGAGRGEDYVPMLSDFIAEANGLE